MAMANGAMKATPTVEQVAVANTANAQKRKSSRIPVLIPKLSYVKPRQYKSTLKKDNSTENCSKGSTSLSPGPPNDDSGIGMDHSMEVSKSPVVSCPSDLTGTGKAEQESLRALQLAVAEMKADLNIIDCDGDAISDSDGDTVTAENVNHCIDPDPEKEVQNAVIEKVDQLLPESLLPPQQLLLVPVVLQEEDTPQASKSPQQPHEMVDEILQNQKGLNSENERELVEEWLQKLIHGTVEEDQLQRDQLQQLTEAPKQLKVESVPLPETNEQQFVREHFEHSTPSMLPMKEKSVEQQLHQNEEVPLKEIQDEVIPSVGEMLQEPVEKNEHEDVLPPLMSQPVEDIIPQGQHDEEKAVEVPTSISVPVGEIEKEAAEAGIVEHLQLGQPAITSEAVESNSNPTEDILAQEEQPAENALTTAEAMMDLQEQIPFDLLSRQDWVWDLISYVNNDMTLQGDFFQLQDERAQTTLNEVDEISELQQDQHHGQLQSNSNAVEEFLELQQEQMDEANGLGMEQMQQPSTSWLLEKFIQTLDNEKNAEQIKKLVEEIIKLQNEQPEEMPPTALQPEQHDEMELSQEVEAVSSPRRSFSHSPLLGMAGLRALEGYLDDGILRHLIQQDVAPAEEALVEQEDNLVDVETIQEEPCVKNAGRFGALLQQLRAYKMPMALFGTAFCLLLFFRKF